MRQLASMAWKEWREVHVFLWIGLGIFLGLPTIGGLEAFASRGRFEIYTTPWVAVFGGVLAVFIAVGISCRDLRRHLDDFWRSRPVNVMAWMLVKYLSGLLVALVSCMLPLAVELLVDRDADPILFLKWLPFLWAALYSIGFLAGCVVRRTAHAAMLALAAMLLVYFLPLVLPPIQWLNPGTIGDISNVTTPALTWWQPRPDQEFAAGMSGIALAALIVALLAVRFDWHVESGPKMMYGSISAAVLILFASAAFQLGTNMPILWQTDVPKGRAVDGIHVDETRGYITTFAFPAPLGQRVDSRLCPIDLTASGLSLGGSIHISGEWAVNAGVHLPGRPEISYYVAFHGLDNDAKVGESMLEFADLETGDEWNICQLSKNEHFSFPLIWIVGKRLYVLGPELTICDISRPLWPRVISRQAFSENSWRFTGVPAPGDDAKSFSIPLPPVPDWTPQQRLDGLLEQPWSGFEHAWAFDGQTLCLWQWEERGTLAGLVVYRVDKLTPLKVTFRRVGRYAPSILEQMFGFEFTQMILKNGLLYVRSGPQGNSRDFINTTVSVFDTRGPHAPRLIAHFGAPGIGTVCPLPDGRAIVGGDKLWIIGPPPHRG